jgi:predicted ATPase
MLGHYRLLGPLGRGGMGEVYLAEDTRLGRKVAVKLLGEALGHDEQRLRRFQQEACTASALNHPNIVVVHEFGEAGGRPFMVTELVEGETLRQRMAARAIGVAEAVEIASQVASALASAHAAGIVHRDVKPENVMLRPDGYVKVLDFGLAKSTRGLSAPVDTGAATRAMVHTEAGTVLGTATYMSPEQARGLAVDARTDLWSLGAVLYEMLARRPPFTGPTAMDVLGAILQNEPVAPSRLAPQVPLALDRVVLKALRKDRAERHQSAEELLRELRALAAGDDGSRAPAQTPTNLPASLTPLVGRDAERATVGALLLRDDVRLVTLTGPSGTGKTRLAVQAAADLVGSYPDGVFLVSLAPVSDAELVAPAIAQVLGVRDDAAHGVVARLKAELRDRTLLLLLDNFEQVLAAAPLVSELLLATPRLKVLATSRAALRVRGEREFPVSPLALPPPEATLADTRGSGAVALFCDRAAAARPDFALTEDNAADVAEVCRRLDGLPLAIELAAARVRMLSPRALRERLSHRLDLLTRGPRDLPPRQQAMRDAIAWSYDLLEEGAKSLFRRLSVFSGGWTLEAAEAICGAAGGVTPDALEAVGLLVDNSLVRRQGEGEPRFAMLETIREFAQEQLAGSGEEEATRAAHAGHFLDLAARASAELQGPEQPAWLERLEAEHDNLRVALDWSIAHRPASALRLASLLWPFWEMRGHFTEGRARLSALLARVAPESSPADYAKVLYAAGVLADAQGDYGAARELFQRNLDRHRAAGNQAGIAMSLNNLAVVVLRQRDLAAARALYEESLGIWRSLGNRRAEALSLRNLGNVAALEKDLPRARALYEEGLAVFRALGEESEIAWSLDHLGDLARDEGAADEASALYGESLALFRRLGDTAGLARVLEDTGRLALGREPSRAAACFAESLAHHAALGDRRGVAGCLEELAALAVERGNAEQTARLAGAAATLRAAIAIPLATADQARLRLALDRARAAIGAEAFAAAWQRGAHEQVDTLVREVAAAS